MAKAEAAASNGGGAVQAPDRFKRLGSVANAPWVSLEDGNIFEGKVLNCYTRPDDRAKDGKSQFYQLELTQSTKCRIGTGADAKVEVVTAGKVVNLNHGPQTKEIKTLIPQILAGAEIHVWGAVSKKISIKGGKQTMWPIDLRFDVAKPAPTGDEPDFDAAE